MKQIIILLAMLGALAGAWHSWQERGLFVKAAMSSEGFSLSAPLKVKVSEHFMRRGIMPNSNADVGLPSPKSLYGTSVKRVAINRGGILIVDFDERIGKQSMTFTPDINKATGLLSWTCTSDSIDAVVLEKLMPPCESIAPTDTVKFMMAIANRDASAVNDLLASGTPAEAVISRDTPLMLAARVGDETIVRQLLDAGVKVDNPASGSDGITPLIVAITNGNADVVTLLLDHGASVTKKDYRGMSAVDHAVIADRRLNEERYVRMVSARFNPEFAGVGDGAAQKAINETAEEERLQDLYLEYVRAAQSCHVQRLSSLLLNARDLQSPELVQGLPISQQTRLPDCAPILHAHLLTKDSYQRSAKAYLADRVLHCDTVAVTRVLKENPDLDVLREHKGRSILDRAVGSGCHTVLTLMVRERRLAGNLDKDIIVKAIGQAPQETLVKLISNLIAARADVNGEDVHGRSPLATAIALEQPVVAKYLVDAGASVNLRTQNGSYPVIEATKKGFEHLVLQMVTSGADLNARDSLGRTALFAAVNRGQQRLVQSLIWAGADIRVTDSNGVNPFLLAESRNFDSIKSLLVASSD